MPANWDSASFRHAKDKVANYIYLKDGQLFWNGSPATEEQVRRYLTFVKRLPRQPITVIDSRDMDCAMAERLRSYVEESLPCTPDLCRFGAFEGVHPQTYVPPTPPAPPPPPQARSDRALPPSGN
ncbi:MAG: hypothetical protein A2885_18690 [Sphingopyxis sp. RIFCSPHIGHO2_01_FULL_65_24]|nr:MAG: hypothetical protein A2885_18690 [Sphingopyxis sp. RIFCSPHIGHO2_01_FULL_65_24]